MQGQKMARYKIRTSSRADAMLLAHADFLSQVSPTAARKLLLELGRSKKVIARTPFIFPYADEFDAPGMPSETYRKCGFSGRYKVLFLVEGRNVYIDAIIDSRQENAELF